MIKSLRSLLTLPLVLAAGTALLSSCGTSGPIISALTLEPDAAGKNAPGYFPVPVELSAEKPAGVTKEPKYRAAPKYGSFTLGGDGGTSYLVALDEPPTGVWKIYLDANHNGDLTDDGDGSWSDKRTRGPNTLYGPSRYVLDVAWKLPDGKTSEGQYGITLVRPSDAPVLGMFRDGARTGTLETEGKAHKLVLIENDTDALFSKPVASLEEAKKGRPVWALIDLNDDKRFDLEAGEVLDIRGPFKLAGRTYEATVSPDGATLKFAASKKEALNLLAPPEPAQSSSMLAVGAPAPDFKAEGPNGEVIDFAKYRGQIVILDFWATWCGPCQESMPHVEQVYQAVKGQPVTVLAVCVKDERETFKKWLKENRDRYHFQFAYDPAGQDDEKSLLAKLYPAAGIPATYIIDKEGKVAAAIDGFAEGDRRIEEALQKLGVSAPGI